MKEALILKNIASKVDFQAIVEDDQALGLRMQSAHTITVKWTGSFPCLCHGEWNIVIDGKKVELPEDIATSPMNTRGQYLRWYFADNWAEEWESYEDGLTFEPWLDANREWVDPLGLSDGEARTLYEAIRSEDWRHGSCGGCI